jgi:hypothetical protein
LPEVARQLRETQDLLRATADEILSLLEDWERRPPEENQAARTLVTALFEKMSFQDLAGQRLAKVEKFLKALGEAVQPTAAADRSRPRRPKPFPDKFERQETGTRRPRQAKPVSKAGGSSETRPRRPKPPGPRETNLKGPQAAGGGLDQSEVEALLADLLP